MAVISRIKSKQVLYTVTRQKMGNTTMTRQAVHPVLVIAIDTQSKRVFASWNSNKPRWYRESEVAKWRVSKPKVKL